MDTAPLINDGFDGEPAKRYLKIPCACMTPNTRRLSALSQIIEEFKPDAVVDFVMITK